MKNLKEFSQFKIDKLQLINGGQVMLDDKTIIVTNCGTEDEDAKDDKDDEAVALDPVGPADGAPSPIG